MTVNSKGLVLPVLVALAAYTVACVVAVATGALFSLLLLGDLDTEILPATQMAPPFLIPSIMLFTVLARLLPKRAWKHLGYWVPAFGLLGWFLVVLVGTLGREGGMLVVFMTACLGASALVVYPFLLWLNRRIA